MRLTMNHYRSVSVHSRVIRASAPALGTASTSNLSLFSGLFILNVLNLLPQCRELIRIEAIVSC